MNSLTIVGRPEDLMLSVHTRHPATQRLALLVGIAAFVVVMFASSYASMWGLWQTSDHRHGLLVLPICAFLVWRLRLQLVDLPIKPDARGLLLVAPIAAAWLIARLAGIQVVEHVAVLAMIPAVVVAFAGSAIAGKLTFPFFFLLFATPVGDTLVPFLMVITADISAALLKLSGFPLLRNGQYISLPGGEFVVADVCAGLRYLTSGVMIALLYGYLTYTSVRKRLILVAVTAFTLVVANGLRAYIVMAVASASRMQYFGGRDHIYFGWLMFGVVIMLIMWIGGRYADDEEAAPGDVPGETVAGNTGSMMPLIAALALVMLAVTLAPLQADFGQTGAMIAAAAALAALLFFLSRRGGRRTHQHAEQTESIVFQFGWGGIVTAIATLAILLLTPRFAVSVENRAINFVDELDLETMVPCTLAGPWDHGWQPRFQDADAEQSASFDCAGEPVGVYVAAYASALQGRELISSSHQVVPSRWDENSKATSYAIQVEDDRDRKVAAVQIDSTAYNGIVWYWYEVDDYVATGPLMTKAYQVLALMRGRPAGGRIIVIETPAGADVRQARERLEFVGSAIMAAGPTALPVDVD